MSRSKLDPNQITQMEHDEASKAKRVKLADTEISIELDHNDGDSVKAHPAILSASALGADNNDNEIIPALDISSMKELMVYVSVQSGTPQGTIQVLVSPMDDGNEYYNLAEMNAQNGMSTPLKVMARRVKIIKGQDLGDAVINVHLIGQS